MYRQDADVSEEAQSRGGCLTAFLVYHFVGSIAAVMIFIGLIFGLTLGRGNSRSLLSSPTSIWYYIVLLIFLVLIWNWKKWGVYGFIAAVIIDAGIYLNSGHSIQDILLQLAGIVILVILIKPRWHLFN